MYAHQDVVFVPAVCGIKDAEKGWSASPHQRFKPFWLFSAPGWSSGCVQVLNLPSLTGGCGGRHQLAGTVRESGMGWVKNAFWLLSLLRVSHTGNRRQKEKGTLETIYPLTIFFCTRGTMPADGKVDPGAHIFPAHSTPSFCLLVRPTSFSFLSCESCLHILWDFEHHLQDTLWVWSTLGKVLGKRKSITPHQLNK